MGMHTKGGLGGVMPGLEGILKNPSRTLLRLPIAIPPISPTDSKMGYAMVMVSDCSGRQTPLGHPFGYCLPHVLAQTSTNEGRALTTPPCVSWGVPTL